MYTIVGYCPRCGAPIYSPTTWMSILPPALTSCACFSDKCKTVTTTCGEKE